MRRSVVLMAKRHRERGFSLAELLVVVAIIGLFCLVSIPAINNYIRAGKVRTANDTLMVDLRAVRYIAITNHTTSTLTINGIAGTWSYTDIHGTNVARTLEKGVTFRDPANVLNNLNGTASVTFSSDGTKTSGVASIVIQGNVLPSVDHQFIISITTVGRLSSAFARV